MDRRVLLLILDGWGIAPSSKGNAIGLAKTPNFDYLWSKYPHTKLAASGEAVGLPAGQIGNSEVGHLNIGAGRVVWQDLPRISNSIKSGEFFENKVLKEAFVEAKKRNKKIHLIGLVSDGGVHSHQEHLYALLSMAKEAKSHNVFVHAITDGRDVPPKSALGYIEKLECKMKTIGVGNIATVSGRYFSMDRDNRFSRVSLAYNALVLGRGEIFQSAEEAVEMSYKRDITDEFIRPAIINQSGLIEDNDVVIFFNLRSDRPRELSSALVSPDFMGFKREIELKNLYFVTMTEYKEGLTPHVAFPLEVVSNTLEEIISTEGLKQLHIAETEKYAHVTFFFDGGKEEPSVGEDRKLIPSPKVATYDLQPEMSAPQITQYLTREMKNYDFIVANFANLDMVGHTGKIPQAVKAAETVDNCLGQIVKEAQDCGFDIIITADHGNAEKMINSDGSICTAHSTNPVPFILVSEYIRALKSDIKEPKLANIAPTVLKLLRIEKPSEMSGRALI